MKLTIRVKKWLHGKRDASDKRGGSALHRKKDGKMCCLGIYLHACGVPLSHLTGMGTPSEVEYPLPERTDWLVEGGINSSNSDDANALMKENDRGASRRKIRRIFAEHGVEVRFV